uniref:hypothetical protein n=1 Tax=Leptospira noguchii TaxID=28182 RepID=UPI000ACB8E3F
AEFNAIHRERSAEFNAIHRERSAEFNAIHSERSALVFPRFGWQLNELLPMGRNSGGRWKGLRDFSLSEKHTFCK